MRRLSFLNALFTLIIFVNFILTGFFGLSLEMYTTLTMITASVGIADLVVALLNFIQLINSKDK